MKKFNAICIFILFLHLSAFSQNSNKLKFQFNFETSYRFQNNKLNITHFTESQEININKNYFVPAYVGLEYFILKNASAELGLGISMNQSHNYRNIGLPASLKFRQYLEDINLALGVNINYEPTSLSLFNKSQNIDLTGGVNSSLSQLNNKFWHIGVFTTYYIQPNFHFNFGYNFMINESKWESKYTHLINDITEKKIGYFVIGIGYKIKY